MSFTRRKVMFPLVHDTDIERHAAAPEIGTMLAAFRAQAGADGRAPLEALRDALGPALCAFTIVVGRGPEGYAALDPPGAPVGPAGMLDRALAEGRPLFCVERGAEDRQVRIWDRLVLPCRDAAGADRPLVARLPRDARADMLDAVLEASCDGIMSLRAVRDCGGAVVDAVVMSANAQACAYAGHPVWRLVDASLRDLFPGLLGTGFWERCLKVVEERTTERFEINLSHQRLDTWLRLTMAPLEDGFVLSFNDITDLKYALFEAEVSRQELADEIERCQALEAELRRLSVTDDLTGVLNRRGFTQALRAQAAQATRYRHDLSLLAVDIDHYKGVNDRFGHAAGDSVLTAVAELFRRTARLDVDIVGRVGGEEFMILLPQTGLGGALIFAERLRARVEAAIIPVGCETIGVTVSIGVHAFARGTPPERLALDADKALYRAKALGRNRTVSFEAVEAAPSEPLSRG